MTTCKRPILTSALAGSLLLSGLLVAGCGGSGGPGAPSGRGNLTFTVQWPDRTRMIPNSANAIRIRIFPEGANVNVATNAVGSKFVVRPGGLPSEVTVALADVAAGTYEVVADGFTGVNDNGTPADETDDTPIGAALSKGQGQVAILAGADTPFTVTMNPELARMRVIVRSASATSAFANLPNSGVVTALTGSYNPDELYFVEAAPQNAAGTALLLPTDADLEISFGGTGGLQLLAQSAETSGATPVARAVFAASGFGTSGFQINYFDGGGAGTGRIQMTFRASLSVKSLSVGTPAELTAPAGHTFIDVGVDDFPQNNGVILARDTGSGTPNKGVVIPINNAGTGLNAAIVTPSTGNFGVVASSDVDGDYTSTSDAGGSVGRLGTNVAIVLASVLDVAQLDGSDTAPGELFMLIDGGGSARSVSRGSGDLGGLTSFGIGSPGTAFDHSAAGQFFDASLTNTIPATVVYAADADHVNQYLVPTSTQPSLLNELAGTSQTFRQVSDTNFSNDVTDIASLNGLLYVLSNASDRVLVFNVRGAKLMEILLPTNAGVVDYTRLDVGDCGVRGRSIVVLRDNNTAVRVPISLN